MATSRFKKKRLSRKPQVLAALTSTVNGAFSKALLPVTPPTDEDLDGLLHHLGLDPAKPLCSFCRRREATDWDHLLAPTANRRPTGHGHTLNNLVPACGPCNQSKGSKQFGKWHPRAWEGMGEAERADISERVSKVQALAEGERLDMQALKADPDYDKYWELAKQVEDLLREADGIAILIRGRFGQPCP